MNPLQTTFVFEIKAQLLDTVDMGEGVRGRRRIVPIEDGTVTGPRLEGRVLSGGADFQLLRGDGVTEIQARYIIESADGARIYVENSGLRYAEPDVLARLNAGQSVDPALVYFYATPKFEVSSPGYAWMERHIFVCRGARYPDAVRLQFFQVA